MKNLLHKIHEKPEHHRKAIALGVSLVTTFMIFGIWISTLPGRINSVGEIAGDTKKQLEMDITPLATVKNSFDEARKSVGDLKSLFFKQETGPMLETVIRE